MTAMELMIEAIEDGRVPRKRIAELLELEREQICQAYNLDPDIMKVKYANAYQWFHDTYGDTNPKLIID